MLQEAEGRAGWAEAACQSGMRAGDWRVAVMILWYRPWRRYFLFRERFFLSGFPPQSVVAIVCGEWGDCLLDFFFLYLQIDQWIIAVSEKPVMPCLEFVAGDEDGRFFFFNAEAYETAAAVAEAARSSIPRTWLVEFLPLTFKG
jgi:hypothetical protein